MAPNFDIEYTSNNMLYYNKYDSVAYRHSFLYVCLYISIIDEFIICEVPSAECRVFLHHCGDNYYNRVAGCRENIEYFFNYLNFKMSDHYLSITMLI